MESDIPETAEEILENLGLSRDEPRIPERFLQDFDERFKDFSNLDSRILSSVKDVRRCSFDRRTPSSVYVENAKNSEKIPLSLGKQRYLTRSKTLMSLHMDSDVVDDSGGINSSLSEDSDEIEKENCWEESNSRVLDKIENRISNFSSSKSSNESEDDCGVTTKQSEYASINSQMEYYDSDSSTYATPCCGSSSYGPNAEDDSDKCPEHQPLLRRRSLSCSDVHKQVCEITSEYTTLCREFRKFRGLNASDSDIQISLNSPARKPHNIYSSLFTSDSEDDDILCVILPTIKDNKPKMLPRKSTSPVPNEPNRFNYVRLVENCEDCDMCRINCNDIRCISFDKNTIRQTSRDCDRFANCSDKNVNFVTKNNACNQSQVKDGSAFRPVNEIRKNFECHTMDNVEQKKPISTSNQRSEKETSSKCDHNVDSAKEDKNSQKQRNRLPAREQNVIPEKQTVNCHSRNKRASTELAELQSVIQNTKVKRESAARQLFLLQELLNKDNGSILEYSHPPDQMASASIPYQAAQTKNQWTDSDTLSELQLFAGRKEMERANSVDALEKTDDDEERKETAKREQELISQLEKLKEEMEKLRLENEDLKSKTAEEKQDTSILEERQNEDSPLPSDLSFDSASPPNSPHKHENSHLWKRLKEAEDRAYQAESRSDELNLLLNHKLIEINKLQLTLSSQTKDLIQLEKAYYQLRCHLHRNRKMTSPSVRRVSSKLNKTT